MFVFFFLFSNIDISICYDNLYDTDDIISLQFNQETNLLGSRGYFEAQELVYFTTFFRRYITLSDIKMNSSSYDPADRWEIATSRETYTGVKLHL